MDNVKATIFAVLIDWVNEDGESNANVHLYDTLEKAKAQVREESITELESHCSGDVYYENSDADTVANLLASIHGEITTVDKDENADWVVCAAPEYFSSYKNGEYSVDHINIQIIQKEVE